MVSAANDTAALVMEWLAGNPGPWQVGLLSQEAGNNPRMFFDYTAGFVTFVADSWGDAGDCLVLYRADGLGQAAFVKAALGEAVLGEEGTLLVRYANFRVAAPGFIPEAYVTIAKII
ncbi:MAG: hypothetical protein ACUVSK_07280 [Desulfotomaculales bacterium]